MCKLNSELTFTEQGFYNVVPINRKLCQAQHGSKVSTSIYAQMCISKMGIEIILSYPFCSDFHSSL